MRLQLSGCICDFSRRVVRLLLGSYFGSIHARFAQAVSLEALSVCINMAMYTMLPIPECMSVSRSRRSPVYLC